MVAGWSRRVIYVQPLGTFTKTERKVIRLTADYMEAYFNLQIKVLDDLPLSLIPAKARRVHPTWNVPQILAPYVLEDVLAPRLPKDAVAYIAFTASDLWPGEGWNFVFGEASLSDRVGVWSLYRYGDPDESEDAFRLFLLRTIKVGTHETSHMFSMEHCIRYECNMCGSNSLREADRCPVWLCPECLAKLCYATGADPVNRYQRLAAFCKAQGLKREQEFFEKSLAVLRGSSRCPDRVILVHLDGEEPNMETVSITLPDSVKQYAEEQVANGGYGSVSQYVAHLIQADRKGQVQAALEAEVLKGLESGESSPMTSEDWRAIREETERRHAARQQKSGPRGRDVG